MVDQPHLYYYRHCKSMENLINCYQHRKPFKNVTNYYNNNITTCYKLLYKHCMSIKTIEKMSQGHYKKNFQTMTCLLEMLQMIASLIKSVTNDYRNVSLLRSVTNITSIMKSVTNYYKKHPKSNKSHYKPLQVY